MTILTVGIDLAKNVFAVHGVNDAGKPELRRPTVPRAKLLELVAALPPCVIGMEACSGAHHWARQFAPFGHTVRLMAPKFVAPYRQSGRRSKNDAADAAAICDAVTRPNMLFVPVKSEEQQQRLMVHRARQGFVEARTATINRIRGLLAEFGIVLPLKASTVRREAANRLEDLPGFANLVIGDLLSEVTRLDERITAYDAHIRSMARGKDNPAQQLMRLSGIGDITATADKIVDAGQAGDIQRVVDGPRTGQRQGSVVQGPGLHDLKGKRFVARASLLNRPLRTRTVGGVGAGS